MYKKFLILLSHFSILLLSWNAQAATLQVTNLNDSGAGSLRNVIASASSGDTIQFTVTGTITLTSGELPITTDITISGPGPSSLEISGGDVSRVFNVSSGTVNISGMIISHGNVASNGGCINNGSNLVLDSVIIENCVATNSGFGGGIYSNTALSITNSTIQSNSSVYGGGVLITSGTFSATNVTIANNTVGIVTGGGFAIESGTATLNNVTVSGNVAELEGGGLSQTSSSTLSIQNSIIAGNLGNSTPDCSGIITSLDYNLIQDVTSLCTFTPEAHDITGVDPNLGPLQDNGGPVTTMALPFDSVSIDAGNNSTCASTDARGVTRPQETNCDMGAFELAPGLISLELDAYSAEQNAGSVTITVLRSSDSDTYDDEVTVAYTTSDGTAVAGTNYTTSSGTLTWAAGNSDSQTVEVPILNAGATSDITFNFTLSDPTGGASLTSPSSAVITLAGSSGGGGGGSGSSGDLHGGRCSSSLQTMVPFSLTPLAFILLNLVMLAGWRMKKN